jgi:hypothetical protein
VNGQRTARLLLLVSAVVASARLTAQLQPEPAAPLDAIDRIVTLFREFRLVALSEGPHNNRKAHEFRLALVRDPRFAAAVDDVVVEFGNARYQPLLDLFVDGADVPYEELRQVWENTTVPGPTWDRPMYHEFIVAIREVNRATPNTLRVVLGDPPIDWDTIRDRAEIEAFYPRRSPYAAGVVRREVLAKNRRALIVYGAGHLDGRGTPKESMLALLERSTRSHIFNISTAFADVAAFEPAVARWPIPSLFVLARTRFGAQPYPTLYGESVTLDWDGPSIAEQFDAELYLGGPSALQFDPLPRALCEDARYMSMRLSRLELTISPQNRNPTGALTRYCSQECAAAGAMCEVP